MVCWLMTMSRANQQLSSRSSPSSSAIKKAAKKRRTPPSTTLAVSNSTDRLPNRYALLKEMHAWINTQRHGRCVFCSALWRDKEKNTEKIGNIRKESKRPWLHCQYCSLNSPTDDICFLCKEHFDIYHAFWLKYWDLRNNQHIKKNDTKWSMILRTIKLINTLLPCNFNVVCMNFGLCRDCTCCVL